MGADFVSLGFCSQDVIAVLPEIPLDSKVEALSRDVQGGGPAANAAVQASRLGVRSAFAGVAGADGVGRWLRDDFVREGVDVSGMKLREGASTNVAYCWIEAPTGKRSVAWCPGTATALASAEVDMAMVRGARVLHLDGHQPEAALAAAKAAREAGVPVSLDAGSLRAGMAELLPYVTILIASEAFARTYTGEGDLARALPKLAQVGAEVTGITMGEAGSMAWQDGQALHCPAFRIRAVDTTGAGDVYHAGFAVRWLETKDLLESMRFASAVSALKCLKLGGRAGMPTRAAVEEAVERGRGG